MVVVLGIFVWRLMDQDEIIDGLKSHLENVVSIVKLSVAAAVLFWWAALHRQDIIEAFGLKIPREYAFFVAVGFYFLMNISAFLLIIRIGDLIKLVEDKNLIKASTRIVTYAWAANPFAYFGDGVGARLHAAIGFGVLIFVWWLGNSSLALLAPKTDLLMRVAYVAQAAFLGIGLATMLAISRVEQLLIRRFKVVDAIQSNKLASMLPFRFVFTFAGIFAGGSFTWITGALPN